MRDLEIRGAGNILGTEQSGHIAAVGYELYCALLEQAVGATEAAAAAGRRSRSTSICPARATFPASYVPDMRLKIDLYRRLARVADAGRSWTISAASWWTVSGRRRRWSSTCSGWPSCGSPPTAGRSSRSTWKTSTWCFGYTSGGRSGSWPPKAGGHCASSTPGPPICPWTAGAASPEAIRAAVKSLLQPGKVASIIPHAVSASPLSLRERGPEIIERKDPRDATRRGFENRGGIRGGWPDGDAGGRRHAAAAGQRGPAVSAGRRGSDDPRRVRHRSRFADRAHAIDPSGLVAGRRDAAGVSESAAVRAGRRHDGRRRQVLARVFKEVVLAHDLEGGFEEFFDQIKGRIPEDQVEPQRTQIEQEMKAGLRQLQEHVNDADPGSFVDPQRRAILQQLIRKQVEAKLIYLDFRDTVPKDNLPNIEQMLNRQFDQSQLPVLLKRENVQSREELEHKLRAKGSSLDRERRIFNEKLIGYQWIHEQVKVDKEVTHEQMLDWYQSHLAEFEKPAKTRWEELMISFSRHENREEAYAAIAALGNQVLAGAPLADVAKARSDGSTAAKGGVRDWTTKGSLVAAELDQAVFSLPPGRLSPIIESKSGYHIVRVIERPGRQPHAVPGQRRRKSRTRSSSDRLNKQSQEFLENLRKKYPVWTIFDETMKRAARPRRTSRRGY